MDIINTQASQITSALESLGFTDAEFIRFEFTNRTQSLEFVFYVKDFAGMGKFNTMYFCGDTFNEVMQKVWKLPNKESRELNRICEHLAALEGMADQISNLKAQAIVSDVLKALDETRKYIADHTAKEAF